MHESWISIVLNKFFTGEYYRRGEKYLIYVLLYSRLSTILASGVGAYYIWINVTNIKEILIYLVSCFFFLLLIETIFLFRFANQITDKIPILLTPDQEKVDPKLLHEIWNQVLNFPEKIILYEVRIAFLYIALPLTFFSFFITNLSFYETIQILVGYLVALGLAIPNLWFFYERMLIPYIERLIIQNPKLLSAKIDPPKLSLSKRITATIVSLIFVPILLLGTVTHNYFSRLLVDHAQFSSTAHDQIMIHIYVIGVASVLLAILNARLLSLTFTFPIKTMLTELEKITKGDLTQLMRTETRNELSMLTISFNQLIESIRYLVEEIQNAGAMIISSSFQVLNIAKQLKKDAATQAVSVSEVGSTADQLSKSFKNIVEQAKTGELLASETLSQAQVGQELIDKNVEAFLKIKYQASETVNLTKDFIEQSKEITQIFEVIQNIVSRTKMIALNASIEASSSGSFGKRFSVIATEIRTLADQSSDNLMVIARTVRNLQKSTGEMGDRIQTEMKTIEDGYKHAKHIQNVFEKILKMNEENTTSVRKISYIAAQQRTAQEQMVESIHQISKVSQKISESSKNLNDLTAQLDDLSRQLNESVQNFYT